MENIEFKSYSEYAESKYYNPTVSKFNEYNQAVVTGVFYYGRKKKAVITKLTKGGYSVSYFREYDDLMGEYTHDYKTLKEAKENAFDHIRL